MRKNEIDDEFEIICNTMGANPNDIYLISQND